MENVLLALGGKLIQENAAVWWKTLMETLQWCVPGQRRYVCVWLWRGDSLATRHSSLTTSSLRFSTDDEAQKRGGKATIRAWMRLSIRTTEPMKLQRWIMVHLVRGSHFWLPTSDTGGSHHVWSGLSPVYPSSIHRVHTFIQMYF